MVIIYWVAIRVRLVFPFDGPSGARLSLTSFETVLLDCIMIAVTSLCINKKKLSKIGEFLCSHLKILKMEEDMQHFQRIWHYFKKIRNATETQIKDLCSVWRRYCD